MKTTKIIIALAMLLIFQSTNVLAQNVEIDRLTIAIAATPNDDKLYAERGTVYFRNGKFTEAISDAGKALQINPKNVNALNLCGNAKFASKDYDGAISDFSQVITLLPARAFRAYVWRGEAFEQKNDLPKALADFNKALEIDPKYVAAYYGRARIYEKQNEFDKAVGEYSLALPNIAPAQADQLAAGFVLRGKALLSAGKSNEAAADFGRVAESNTKSFGEAAYLLGMMFRKIGKNTEAEKLFLRAKEGKYADAETILKTLANQMQNDVAALKEINRYNERIAAFQVELSGFTAKLQALASDDYTGKANISEAIHKTTAALMALYKEQVSKYPKGVLSPELEKSYRSTTNALESSTMVNTRTRPYRVANLRIIAEQTESAKRRNIFANQMNESNKANDNAAYDAAKQKFKEETKTGNQLLIRGIAKLASFNDWQWTEDKKDYDRMLDQQNEELKRL